MVPMRGVQRHETQQNTADSCELHCCASQWSEGPRRRHCANAWDHSIDSQAGSPHKGDQPQKTGGRLTQSTSGHQPHKWAGRR